MAAMRRSRLLAAAFAACAWCAAAPAQNAPREPKVGYLYPAGGRAGTTVQVAAGGQALRDPQAVLISGGGVSAKVIRHVQPLRPLDGDQRKLLQERLRELHEGRRTSIFDEDETATDMMQARAEPGRAKGAPDAPGATDGKAAKGAPKEVTLPHHPLIQSLEKLSAEEVRYVLRDTLNPRKRQPNQQIGELVVMDVTLAPDAAPGQRELRILSRAGISNPMRFEVGQLPEFEEREPNNPDWRATPMVEQPSTLNGQITAGDVDRFRFRARSGEKLVLATQARQLVPYLADAVPGWFQATLALRDSRGREVAFGDDFGASPDPVLCVAIPADDEYTLEIRDALYRGREDFVYRVTVGQVPYATAVFPLGGRAGSPTPASVAGWNLPGDRVSLDTASSATGIRQGALKVGNWVSNPVSYAVDTLPERAEAEPNDTRDRAQAVAEAQVVNGHIAAPGDADVYRFRGGAGSLFTAEVVARRAGSPLDSLLKLADSKGAVLATSDDSVDNECGLMTHHADSLLTATLPRDGDYFVTLGDTQGRGGAAYAYRLRMGPARPDFALRITPSGINIPPGGTAVATVHALRKDGFAGDIEIAPAEGESGFAVAGGRIPAGRDKVRVTITARGAAEGVTPLRLEGRAQVAGAAVVRPVVPADDMMQAFAYRHLVPAQELLVSSREGGRQRPLVRVADPGIVRIPAGGTAEVRIAAPRRPGGRDFELKLHDPPRGITLDRVTSSAMGAALVLKAAADAPAGPPDNLIVEALIEPPAGARRGSGGAQQGRRVPVGVLPAIPFEVVRR
jgi:hypothetical protein